MSIGRIGKVILGVNATRPALTLRVDRLDNHGEAE